MGYVLDRGPGDKLGGEVRRESFYVYGLTWEYEEDGTEHRIEEPTPVYVYVDTYAGNGTGTVEFMLSDIPELRRLLDQVEAHQNRRFTLQEGENA